MDIKNKQLTVFGYGLAILIPFFMASHVLKGTVPGIGIVLSLIFVLYLLSHIERLKVIYYLLLAYLYFVIINGSILTTKSYVFIGISFGFLLVSIKNIDLLKPLFDLWMKLAHVIGAFFTFLVLGIMFFGVFAPVGIVLRLLRKDLLNKKIDLNAKSYWIKREESVFCQEKYKKQF